MGVGQHGDVVPLFGTLLDEVENGLVLRHQHLLVALFDGEGHGGVVDILRGETEMDELLVGFELQGVEMAFEEILHGLDVVVGDFFYIFDFLGIVVGEVAIDVAQLFGQLWALVKECFQRQLRDTGQGNKIFYLHTDTVTDEGTLGKEAGKGFHFGTIAAVDGRDGIETIHNRQKYIS